MKDTKRIYEIVKKNTEIGYKIENNELRIWFNFKDELRDMINESSAILERLFNQDEWYEFGESLGVRCDGEAYFQPINEEVARWLNYDMIYDGEYSDEKSLSCDVEIWLERVERFKNWWDRKGSHIFAEILAIENRKDVEVLKLKHLLDEYKSAEEIESINISLPVFMAIGGKIYKLQFEERAENNIVEAMQNEIEIYKKALKGIVERKEKALKIKMEEMLKRLEESIAEVPKWMTSTQRVIKHGISIVRNKTTVFILFPIKYNPKYVKREGKMYRIKDPDRLRQDVIAKVRYTTGRLVPPLSLWDEDGKRFYHYHSTDEYEDCTGALDFPEVTSFEQLIEFKEKVEKSLEIINIDDIARREPDGMPHIDDIEVEKKEEIGWKA